MSYYSRRGMGLSSALDSFQRLSAAINGYLINFAGESEVAGYDATSHPCVMFATETGIP